MITVRSTLHPSKRAVAMSGVLLALALPSALFDPRLIVIWLLALATFVFVMGSDLLRIPGSQDLTLEIHPALEAFVGRPLRIEVVFRDRLRRARAFEIGFDVSDHLVAPTPRFVDMPADDSHSIAFAFQTVRRGTAVVQACWIRFHGPLGAMARTKRFDVRISIPIVPDVLRARDEALRFMASPSFDASERSSRWLGLGTQFHTLRDYFPGADTRSIDWKATARHRKLLMREFQEERNRQLVFAIDTGRSMNEPIDGLSRLDRAIVAALSLTVVALRSSDRVGLFAFDARPRSFLEPASGRRAWDTIRRATADLEYTPEETNFALGISSLLSRLRRRTLVVVFTEFVDSITGESMTEHLKRLARKHVVIFVALSDPLLHELRSRDPRSLLDVQRAVVADDLLHDRAVVLRTLQRAGVRVIDARAEDVSNRLLDHYLEVRRRELVG